MKFKNLVFYDNASFSGTTIIQVLDTSPVIRGNRRNSCTQITDGEVDTMITETENPVSEKSPSRK